MKKISIPWKIVKGTWNSSLLKRIKSFGKMRLWICLKSGKIYWNQMVKMLFNKVFSENEKWVFYFYLKMERTFGSTLHTHTHPYTHTYMLLLFSRQVMSDSLQPHELQHTRSPHPSLSPGVCPSSCPLNWLCHPAISSSVTPFFFCFQSFPASGSFPMS